MSTITLPNERTSSDVTMRTRLKDGGVAIDWASLTDIKAWLYSDAQKALMGRCDVSITQADSTLLACEYAATKPQYPGIARLIVQAKYQGRTKTYDKPAFNFVPRTAQATGQETIDDPEVDVEIEVEDVSSSILDAAIAAALQAAEDAEHAAHLIPNQVLLDCEEATGHAQEATRDANDAAGAASDAKDEALEAAAAANAAGITSVVAQVQDNEPGTPSVDATLLNKVLTLVFHYLKGAKGDTGATPNITIGTVTTGAPGSNVVVTLTGTAEAPVLNFTIPQGLRGIQGPQGNTGSSVDYPFELVDNLFTEDATKALTAAQGAKLQKEKTDKSAGKNKFNGKYTDEGYRFNYNGTLTGSGGNAVSEYIPVDENTDYCYSSSNPSYPPMLVNHYLIFYDANKAVLSSAQNTSGNVMTFTTPAGCAFIRTTINLSALQYQMQLEQGITRSIYAEFSPIGGYFAEKVQPKSIGSNELAVNSVSSEKIANNSVTEEKTDFIDVVRSDNLLPYGGWESGYYNSDGSEGVSATMCRKKVLIDGTGTYMFYVYRAFFGTGAANIPAFDADGNYVKTINGTLASSDSVAMNTIVITQDDIDQGVVAIGMSYFSNNAVPAYPLSELMLIKGSIYPSQFIYYAKAVKIDGLASGLVGKKVVFDGDSICAGLNSAKDGYGNGWPGRIGVDNAMDWHNVGVSGGVIANISGVSHILSSYIDTIHNNYPSLDYLILEGGTNDADRLFGLNKEGTMVDTDFSGSYDDTTFIGALETLFYKAQMYYPNAKVGFIVAQKMGRALNSDNNPDPYVANRRHFFDLAVQVCEKWGIPYIDLWKEGYLNPNVTSMYDKILTSQQNVEAGKAYYDGQHLTAVGYNVISPKIEAWMKTL